MMKALLEIEEMEISKQKIRTQLLDENVKQMRIITKEIKKGQEILNNNLWTIFKEIKK